MLQKRGRNQVPAPSHWVPTTPPLSRPTNHGARQGASDEPLIVQLASAPDRRTKLYHVNADKRWKERSIKRQGRTMPSEIAKVYAGKQERGTELIKVGDGEV
jgi:hypothetical protein